MNDVRCYLPDWAFWFVDRLGELPVWMLGLRLQDEALWEQCGDVYWMIWPGAF